MRNRVTSIKRWIEILSLVQLITLRVDEAVFNEAAVPYQEAMYKSGYTYKLEFKPPQRASSQNPPESIPENNLVQSAKSNIGREFLRLIDKCVLLAKVEENLQQKQSQTEPKLHAESTTNYKRT